MNPRLFLQVLNHSQVNLLYGQAVQHTVQQDIQFQHRLLVQFLGNGNHFIPHQISFCHNHGKNLGGAYLGKLNKLQLVPMINRRRYHSGIVGIGGQNLHHLLKHTLHLVSPLNHQLLELTDLPVLFFHHAVHIETIALIRGNSAG